MDADGNNVQRHSITVTRRVIPVRQRIEAVINLSGRYAVNSLHAAARALNWQNWCDGACCLPAGNVSERSIPFLSAGYEIFIHRDLRLLLACLRRIYRFSVLAASRVPHHGNNFSSQNAGMVKSANNGKMVFFHSSMSFVIYAGAYI
jgi:hypothetical protein